MKKIFKSLLVFTLLFSYFLPTIEVFADTLDQEETIVENNNVLGNELLNEETEDTSLLADIDVTVYNANDDTLITPASGVYNIDKLAFGTKSPVVKMVSDNTDLGLVLENTYHQIVYLNDLIFTFETFTGEELLNKTGDQLDFSNLSSGTYKLKNVIFDEEFNVVGSYELDFTYANSDYQITTLTLDSIKELSYDDLVNLLVNYKALTEEEINELQFTEDANLYIRNIIENYDTVIFDLLLNYSQAGASNVYDSNYELDGENYQIVTGFEGVFDYNVELGFGTTVQALKDAILTDSIYLINDVIVKNEDGTEASYDKLLETGMTVTIKIADLEVTYHIIVKGNLVNQDGIIDASDFDEIILVALEMSEVSKLYEIAADINEDKIVNIFDVASLLSDYAEKGEDETIYQTEINLESNYTDVNVGDTFDVRLITNGEESLLTGLQGILNYDPELVSLENVYFNGNVSNWFGNANIDSASASFGKFIYLGLDAINGNENILTFEFKVLQAGDINISLTEPLAINNTKALELVNNMEDNTKAYEVNLTAHRTLSSNADISNIELSTGSLSPTFSPDITSYQVFVPEYVNTLTITGTLADMLAQTDGFKTYNLVNNYTSIELVVTAEDGTTKTYTINVTKYAVKSSDNYLSSLEIKGYDIKFNKYTTNYDLTIKNHVKSLDISYLLNDSSATVEIIGNTNLKDQDKISIIVTAENGNQRTYTITIHKEKVEATVSDKDKTVEEENNFNFSRFVLVLLIIAVIIGLIYMLFRSDKEENAKFEKLNNDLSSNDYNNSSNKSAPVKEKKQKKNNKNVKRKS